MNNKIKLAIKWIFFLIFLSIFSVSAYVLIKYYSEYAQSENTVDELVEDYVEGTTTTYATDETGIIIPPTEEEKPEGEFVSIYKDLSGINSDFVGWLYIPDTKINYPVMQSKNNEQYYLHRDFHKKYSFAGTLFCNAAATIEEPSMNIIIYGHHMRINSMFHSLEKYKSKSYYDSHRYIYFTTNYWSGVYEVIAAYKTDVNRGTYKYYEFVNGTEEEFMEYVNYARNRTPYSTPTAHYGDQLLTLSTCAYHTNNGRFVVVARRIMQPAQTED